MVVTPLITHLTITCEAHVRQFLLIMWQFLSRAPAKSVATICPLSKELSFNTITTECKQMEEHSVLPTQILYLNFLMFPLFCPPSVSAENQTWHWERKEILLVNYVSP
jgi:hypothetical protein